MRREVKKRNSHWRDLSWRISRLLRDFPPRRVRGHILGDDAAGADDRIFPDGNASEQRGAGADRSASLNEGALTIQSASVCSSPSALVARG